MSPLAVSVIVLACIFAGALAGMLLRLRLPDSHLSPDSKDVVRLAVGLIGTLTALVIGLMIASAKGSYDRESARISRMSADIVLLDRLLADYGAETDEARNLLRRSIGPLIGQIWAASGSKPSSDARFSANGIAQAAYQKIETLSPTNEGQRSLQTRAVAVSTDLAQTLFLMLADRGDVIPTPFVVMIVFWLTMIFASFSLFARPNATLVAIMFILALSGAGAIFLVLDFSRPFSGIMTISDAPLREALGPLG
jgi:hypothetical protein